MGIMDFLKKQLIDVIDWTESDEGTLAFRYPMQDREIQTGAHLTVTESQLALFVNEGEIADLFGPGRHQLTTKNLPLMTNLKHWDTGFNSPFKSDLYFFSTRTQLDQKWGTQQPITVRDKDYGPIRIRAFGTFTYRIRDPKVFFKKVSGTRERYTTTDMEGQLRSVVATSIASHLASAAISFVDMAANQLKFSETLLGMLDPDFAQYGLKLETFHVQSVSLPEELQAKLDERAGMSMAGNLDEYAKYQAAKAIGTAAANPGGLAGAGVGLGAGAAIGQAMAGALGGGGAGGAAKQSEDAAAALERLHGLLQKGVITQAEYDAKKAELIKKL
jgi:membrane protease subunit (stomatin/prohibitin family)